MSGLTSLPLALGAVAGGLAALAAREAILAAPVASDWLRLALEPLRRVESEGYTPSTPERRRLAAVGAAGAVVSGWLAGGVPVAVPLAVAGPLVVGLAINRRRNRYRRSIERALPEVATAVADSLSAGRSLRAALEGACESLDGPPAAELSRLAAELEMGAPTATAVNGLRERFQSSRVDAFSVALLSQRLSGGDLAALLRSFAVGAAERDRVAEDARAATAQARFTGLLVVAMPTGAALFAELMQPGFFSRILASPLATTMLGVAVVLQLGGFAAIRRLSRPVQ